MPNADQREYWNDSAGEKWVEHQDALDAMLVPATQALIDVAAIQAGEKLLDVGCGTGETSLIAANAGAVVTGVDISEPMLRLAQSRLGDLGTILHGDAAEYRLDEPADVVISRFGVMFFDDPIDAFKNILSNLKQGGRMAFVCWQAPQDNDWVMIPMAAIMPQLPEQPKTDPNAPGPFAFANSERLNEILQDAGFDEICIEPHSLDICMAQSGGIDQAVSFSSQIGPAARAMGEVDEVTRLKILESLKKALEPFESHGRVTLGGAIWVVTAKRAA